MKMAPMQGFISRKEEADLSDFYLHPIDLRFQWITEYSKYEQCVGVGQNKGKT